MNFNDKLDSLILLVVFSVFIGVVVSLLITNLTENELKATVIEDKEELTKICLNRSKGKMNFIYSSGVKDLEMDEIDEKCIEKEFGKYYKVKSSCIDHSFYIHYEKEKGDCKQWAYILN